MINIYLMLAILIANIAAIGIVYNFIKKLPKKEILVFIAMSVTIMYVLISIIYWFTGFKVNETVHESSKNYVIIKLYFIKIVVVLLLVLIIEYFYICNIQNNIAKIGENIKENIEMTNNI